MSPQKLSGNVQDLFSIHLLYAHSDILCFDNLVFGSKQRKTATLLRFLIGFKETSIGSSIHATLHEEFQVLSFVFTSRFTSMQQN